MSVNQRIKQVRLALGLSQAKFAKAIPISNGYIAGIELENRKVNDRIIKLVCAAYGANEGWLRYGEGDMFARAPDEKLERLISNFNELSPKFQDYILKQIDDLLKLQTAEGGS